MTGSVVFVTHSLALVTHVVGLTELSSSISTPFQVLGASPPWGTVPLISGAGPIPFELGGWFRSAASGTMVVAVPVAILAGLVSFFSPCILPLLPGYLAFATGLGAAEINGDRRPRLRMLLGTSLFVLGFGAVFVLTGAVVGTLGSTLLQYRSTINIVAGVLAIVLGLIFAGWLPIGQREMRLRHAPTWGIAAAPLLGMVFGLGWTPCIGPTLSVVLTLALSEGTANRGAFLALCYAIGLGIPFILAGQGILATGRRLDWFKKHQRRLQQVGGVMLILVGVLLLTGLWDRLASWALAWAATFGTPI